MSRRHGTQCDLGFLLRDGTGHGPVLRLFGLVAGVGIW